MKKVLVLGAGRGQLPVMELCHKYGAYVITVSPKGDYPGFKIADKCYYENVKSYEAVLEIAKKENIDAVITDQLDAGVYTAAYVSEKLGVNGITSEVALKFTNKFAMREAAKEAGICVPKSICVESVSDAVLLIEKDAEMTFPLIMKPVDSAASRGIHRLNKIDDLIEHFSDSKKNSYTGKVIIEQFIYGKEYVVDAYTHDYKTTNLVFGTREYFDIPGTFIPSATIFSDAESADSELEKRIKAINKKLVENNKLKFGITHAEYIHDTITDKVYLVEIAARGGGVFISSDLIPTASHIDANDLLVRDALGLEIKMPLNMQQGASAYVCYLVPEGTVSELNGLDEIEKIPGVHKAFFDNIELGMQTNSIRDKSSRKGPILVKGKTKEECYQVIAAVKEKLSIKIKTANGIEDILWN